MTENTELMTVDNIWKRVYVIRDQQVMLDYDLAEIYGYEVKRLNEQVKRNITRFPEDFMFQVTKDEIPENFSKSQFATLNENGDRRGTNIKKLPYAFTEQGIYMLATVNESKTKIYIDDITTYEGKYGIQNTWATFIGIVEEPYFRGFCSISKGTGCTNSSGSRSRQNGQCLIILNSTFG